MFADRELGGAGGGGAGAGASAGQFLRQASPRGSVGLHTPPRYPEGRQGSLRAAGRPDPGARG